MWSCGGGEELGQKSGPCSDGSATVEPGGTFLDLYLAVVVDDWKFKHRIYRTREQWNFEASHRTSILLSVGRESNRAAYIVDNSRDT